MKIETERLILRKARASDWKDIVEGAGEYDVARHTKNIPYPYSQADAEWFIKDSVKRWGNTGYAFMIELKAERKLIGVMGLRNVNMANGTASTGSWINKKYWRQGYITEAKIAVNDFAFNQLGLRRLNSTVNTNNKASNATQQKVGYVLEGMQRKGSKSKATGKITDLNLYGLLKEDWIRARKKLMGKSDLYCSTKRGRVVIQKQNRG